VAVYDAIGATYAATRRADPRIAAQLWQAVGPGTVVNVGAGTGSYEPPATQLAVEPSAAMIAQRPAGAAPCVQGSAEALPAADDAFDVALAVLTVHHWSDLQQGLAELRRVARRTVLLTWDARRCDAFWLLRDYLPGSIAWEQARFPAVDELARRLGGRVDVVPVPHDCIDGFAGAFWRRPAAYLDPLVRAGMSNFADLGEAALPALERLRADLESGAWHVRNRELLALDALDLGYRIVVADRP
jgi:SAM-dependent methyltransferase